MTILSKDKYHEWCGELADKINSNAALARVFNKAYNGDGTMNLEAALKESGLSEILNDWSCEFGDASEADYMPALTKFAETIFINGMQEQMRRIVEKQVDGYKHQDYEMTLGKLNTWTKDREAVITDTPTKIFGPNLEEILNSAGFYRGKEWVDLTNEEMHEIHAKMGGYVVNGWGYERAIEAKLKEKNT